MQYQGDSKLLFKTIHKGKVLYRYGVLSDKKVKKIKLCLDNKAYYVPVQISLGIPENLTPIKFQIYDKTLYIKINNIDLHGIGEVNNYLKELDSICNYFEKTDKIVLNFSSNTGGYFSMLSPILYKLLYKNETSKEAFNKIIKYYHSGACYLNSQTIIDRFILEDRNKNKINKLRNNSQKYIYENSSIDNIELPKPWYKGKLFIVTNATTASAAEKFILLSKLLFGDSVTILGLNTYGALDYPDVYRYSLPSSKIVLQLSRADFSNTRLLKNNPLWNKDTKGIYPDYWIPLDEIIDDDKLILEAVNEIPPTI